MSLLSNTHQRPPTGSRSAAGPVVSVRDLRQSYGDFEAVGGISFDIRAGELYALLGTNGAGKTTTIETLEGFRRPTGGEVRVFGLNPYKQPRALRQRTNAVLQSSGTFTELTVKETVELARRITADPLGLHEVLEKVGLTDKAKVKIRQLSGGQKRRVDLALAIVSRPEVLFLDEPTTGMDPEARRDTWQVISALVEGGAAVLLTTHYLEEAERLAHRLGVMHRGRMRVEGALSEVLTGWGDHIGFRLPAEVRTGELPALPGAEVAVQHREDHLWVSYSVKGDDTAHRAHRAMARLLEWASHERVWLDRLSLRSASLEDVFLNIADGSEVAAMGGAR